MICYSCNEELQPWEAKDTDGYWGLCDECAKKESNRIFDNLMRIYESEEEVFRKAFAVYGIDDFAYCVDEEIKK